MINNTVLDLINQYGYFFFFLAFTLGPFGIPIPNEVTILSAAILSQSGVINQWVTYLCILSGLLTAITLAYFIGNIFGHGLKRKLMNNKHFIKAEAIFRSKGDLGMCIGMFILVVRYLMPLLVELSGIENKKFAVITYSSALIWTTIFFAVGTFFGEPISAFLKI